MNEKKLIVESWVYKSFLENNLPNWKCPTCNNSTLSLNENFIHKPCEAYQKIPQSYYDANSGVEMPLYKEDLPGLKTRFIGFLNCNSKRCNEFVSISGYVLTERCHLRFPFSEFEEIASNYEDYFYPVLFDPPLNFIENTYKYPKHIQDILKDCYKLYWISNSACANMIRILIESLLYLKKIRKREKVNEKKKRKDKKKTTRLSLHNRLILFKEKCPEIADFLLSIKWIGNKGSHFDRLSNKDIIDAFELLEHALNFLYINDKKRLDALSKRINRGKPDLEVKNSKNI